MQEKRNQEQRDKINSKHLFIDASRDPEDLD